MLRSCVMLRTIGSHVVNNSCHGYQTTFVRCMAGHSKWQNIRHTKGAKDAERSKSINRVCSQIEIACREGGGSDPKFNRQLERVILDAKKNNVPLSTIQNYMKKLAEKNTTGKVHYVMCRGPFLTGMIVEVFVERLKFSREKIQSVVRRYGATVSDASSVAHSFEMKGVLYVAQDGDNKVMTLDEAEEVAIEAGAEEVIESDNSGTRTLRFITDTSDLHTVKKALESEHGLVVEEARIEYIPLTEVELETAVIEKIGEMYDKMEDLGFINRIYDNIKAKGT